MAEMKEGVTQGFSKDLRSKSDDLSQADIEHFVSETKKWIGREIELDSGDKWLAEQPVEPSEIRRFALFVLDGNPLYCDREYAKKTIWKDVIAPPIFIQHSYQTEVLGTVPVSLPGVLQAQHWLHSGIDLTLYLPCQPGDYIKPTVYFDNIEVTTGKFIGQMFRNSTKTIVRNQCGDVMTIQKHYDMLYSVAKAQEKNPYGNIDTKQGIPPLVKPDNCRWTTKRQGAVPRYWEDVNVGDDLPAQEHTLYVTEIVAQAAAIRTGIEYPLDRGGCGCHWHYNPVTCFTVRGMPLPFDYGQMRYNWCTRLLQDWAGDNAWLYKIVMQARKPIFAGDVTSVKGKIEKKYVEDGRHCVDIYVSYDNQRSEVSCKGTCTVILPSKQNPKAPLLPAQPKL
jgi:hypothetical protein